jgi:predicted nucleotidyltransferase
MTPVTDDVLKTAALTLGAVKSVTKVVLFGSRARGDHREDSDIDLLVVEDKTFGPKVSRRKEMTALSRRLSSLRAAIDVLVYSQKEYAYWCDSLNHVVGRASRVGRVLYERH